MSKIDELSQKIVKLSKKEMQARHQQERLENTLAYMEQKARDRERKARTHRLANKGGTVEHFFPKTKGMNEEDFFNLMQNLMEISDFKQMVWEQVDVILYGGRK